MESQNIQPRIDSEGKSEVIDLKNEQEPKYIPLTKKFEAEIRYVVRIHPKDFESLVNSFTDWSSQWE